MNNNPLAMGLIMVAIFVAGLLLGRMSIGSDISPRDIGTSDSALQSSSTSAESASGSGSGTMVNTANLTPGQRTMLKALGIDADNVTITPAMIACAEASLGPARTAEIKNGATPTMSEGVKLIACYK